MQIGKFVRTAQKIQPVGSRRLQRLNIVTENKKAVTQTAFFMEYKNYFLLVESAGLPTASGCSVVAGFWVYFC